MLAGHVRLLHADEAPNLVQLEPPAWQIAEFRVREHLARISHDAQQLEHGSLRYIAHAADRSACVVLHERAEDLSAAGC